KSEGLGPVRARVFRDRCIAMAFCAAFHVRGFGRAMTIEASAIAPFRVELDTVGRVRHHQRWLDSSEHTGDILRRGPVAAEEWVRTEDPQIPSLGNWILRWSWRCVLRLLGEIRGKKSLQFSLIKAGQLEVVINGLQILEFELQELGVPFGPVGRAIHEQ